MTDHGNQAVPSSASDLIRRAVRARPDGLALVDGPARLTWSELDARASAAALALRASGLDDGDRVALQLGTSIDFVVLYLGADRAGLITVPVNPAYTLPELSHVLDDSGARLLVTSNPASVDVAGPQIVTTSSASAPGKRTVAELLDAAPAGDDPRHDRVGEDIALLLYTSGTSGRPKGAMLSARALLANLAHVAALDPPMITGSDVAYVPLPLFHVFGLNAGLGIALHAGATSVLADRFDPLESLATMAAERVTVVIGAPGMFAQWASRPELATGFAGVRYAVSGSAPLPAALVATYASHGIVLHEGYGLTEAAPGITLNRAGKAGSIGRALPGVEIELRDQDGSPVSDEDDDPGELYVRGRNLFSGYWPAGDGGPDTDGWFGTGDIAVRDDDGNLALVGRSSELVLVNGFNVYPAEVESVLGAQPGVAEVAVVGAEDPETGEAVVAYVVPAPGAVLDVEQLLAAASGSLAKFKLPRSISLVEALPHTVTGKVMKWRLRAEPPVLRIGKQSKA
ncbi:MAG TPA: AMP-binding protein [Jatrophihabitantaceae bacterium]|nr:AMP-binding protein [Jatrophihabitantaceae bacterium]